MDVPTNDRVMVLPPVPVPDFWRMKNTAISETEFHTARITALKQAVRMTQSGTRSDIVTDDVMRESDLLSEVGPEIRTQIPVTSQVAIQSFETALERNQSLQEANSKFVLTTLDRDAVVQFRHSLAPPLLDGITLLAGISMILIPYLFNRRERQRLPTSVVDKEASTIVSQSPPAPGERDSDTTAAVSI
jgi:hypothetical protein